MCRCNNAGTARYYDVTTNACVTPLKAYDSLCQEHSECIGIYNSRSQCVTTGGQFRCRCTTNIAYLNAANVCTAKAAWNVGCTVGFLSCQDYALMTCSGGTCACGTGMFRNTTSNLCQWEGRQYDFCTNNGINQCSTGYTCQATLNYCL